MTSESVGRGAYLGLAVMAFGLTLVAVGLMIATGGDVAKDDPGPLITGITLAGLALFIVGAVFEVRDRLRPRRRR